VPADRFAPADLVGDPTRLFNHNDPSAALPAGMATMLEHFATLAHATYGAFQQAGFSEERAFQLTQLMVEGSWNSPPPADDNEPSQWRPIV
jgi:hypothetical protein